MIRHSIIIPAYNEAARLPSTLLQVTAYFDSLNEGYELLVVDDGSTDETALVVRAFAANHPQVSVISNARNLGKGAVVQQGMLAAAGSLRLFTDADLSTPIEEYAKLRQAMVEGTEIAFGSRALRESDVQISQPKYREWLGRFFNQVVRWIYLPEFHDTQCGFKLFSARAAEQIFSSQQLTGIIFDVEILYLAKQLGFQAIEVPVIWRDSGESRFAPSFSNAIGVFRELWQIRRHVR